mgnify:CR=1 FL=1
MLSCKVIWCKISFSSGEIALFILSFFYRCMSDRLSPTPMLEQGVIVTEKKKLPLLCLVTKAPWLCLEHLKISSRFSIKFTRKIPCITAEAILINIITVIIMKRDSTWMIRAEIPCRIRPLWHRSFCISSPKYLFLINCIKNRSIKISERAKFQQYPWYHTVLTPQKKCFTASISRRPSVAHCSNHVVNQFLFNGNVN